LNYSRGNPFSFQVLFGYWVAVINEGISAYYFFVLGFLVIAQAVTYLFYEKRSVSRIVADLKTPIWIMLLWFLVPFIVFSFGVNKDFRYLLPVFPPVGFIIAKLITRFFYKEKFGKVMIILLIAFPCFMFGYISLPLSSNYSLQAGPFVVIAPQVGIAFRPVNQTWPLEKILIEINDDVRKNNQADANSPVFIGVVPNCEYFNVNNLGYFSAHHNLPFAFELFEAPANNDWTVQKDRIISKDYFITKTGDLGPTFAYNSYLTPLLLHGELPFTELARFKLPDGSDGIIYKRYSSISHSFNNVSVGDEFATHH
jgi:hypothetical protein